VHTPDAQSPATPHTLPSAQGEHDVPPQSVSVSAPFFCPSLQPGAAHTFAEHTANTQSGPFVQDDPCAHGGQLPPQSRSVSSPFFVPSEQLGERHR
jgi:hypothetical protein